MSPLPTTGKAVYSKPQPPSGYVPSLIYSDQRNSQYLGGGIN